MRISNQHVFVPRNKITGQLCTILTTIVDLNQLPLPPTDDLITATVVNTVVRDSKNTPSPEGAISQAPDSWRNTIRIPDNYDV